MADGASIAEGIGPLALTQPVTATAPAATAAFRKLRLLNPASSTSFAHRPAMII
jgi:hypothetical protein